MRADRLVGIAASALSANASSASARCLSHSSLRSGAVLDRGRVVRRDDHPHPDPRLVEQLLKDHHSTLYDDAWMPNMQRITWNGIARPRFRGLSGRVFATG
jgi:hypothetical protein